MKKINWKDIGIRCLKTFIQGVVAYLAVSISTTDFTNKEAVKGLIIGTIASGVSALMNIVNNLLKGDEINERLFKSFKITSGNSTDSKYNRYFNSCNISRI